MSRFRTSPQSLVRHRTGSTIMTGLALLAAVVSVSAVALLTVRSSQPPAPPQATGRDAITWMARVGITPKVFAAAGCSSGDATATVSNARAHLTEHLAGLRSAEDALGQARGAYERMVDAVQSGHATAEQTASLAGLRVAYDNARAATDTALAAFQADALAGLTENQRALIATIQTNKAWDVPPQYKVVTRTDDEWLALRDALAIQRIAQRHGKEVAESAQQLLTTVNADGHVSAAAAGLNANLATLNQTWTQASNP